MTLLQAFILGVVQGITEFFPVSSSTHLSFAKKLLQIQDSGTHFDLFCHVGTLLAICIALRKDIWSILHSPRTLSLFFLALIPLIPAYLFFKPLRLSLASYTPLFLLGTSALLFLACRSISPSLGRKKWRDVLCIGMAQSFALLPGISRSASTISAARILGWSWEEATRFSFLLAIPTILGGTLIETLQVHHLPIAWEACIMGFGAAFITGLGTIRLFIWMLSFGTVRPFAWYCLTIGVLAWLL